MINRWLITSIIILAIFACNVPTRKDQTHYTVTDLSEEDRNSKLVIYQIFTRLFGNSKTTNKRYGTLEENGVGKFNDISEVALSELRKMGITHVWYTGAIEHAVMADYRDFGIVLDDADVVKGRAGSPYAIKDYYDVNPDLAEDIPTRMAEFEALIDRTHKQGLKVIVDFVPNHVARQYISDSKPEGVKDLGEEDDTTVNFHPDNNYYYLPGTAFQVPDGYVPLGPNHTFITKDGKFHEVPAKATGNDKFVAQPHINDWFETVKLNYGVDIPNGRTKHFEPIPSTWKKMLDILNFWASRRVDGFRCDMAEMVPAEFWNWVIPKIKANYSEVVFIAEIYNPDQYEHYINFGRFDYLYDKVQLYDTLKHIMQGGGSTDNIPGVERALNPLGSHMLRFLENHDEQRIASPFFAGDARKGKPALLVSAALNTGPLMIYFGQEVGEPGAGVEGFSGEDGRTTIFDYWGVPEHQKWMNNGKFDGELLAQWQKELRSFYMELLQAVRNYEAIRSGEIYDLQYFNRNDEYSGYSDKVYTWLRYTDVERLLLIANFKNEAETINLRIPSHAFDLMGIDLHKEYHLKCLLGDFDDLTFDAETFSDKKQDGLKAELPPLAALIFAIEPKAPHG